MTDRAAICRLLVAATVLAALAVPGRATATLGGDASSVANDRVRAQGALVRSLQLQNGAYSLQEMQSPSGVTIREYLSSSGTVFGVAWQGPWLPDLQQLLGPYYARYQQEAQQVQQARRSHGPITVQDPDFVVQIGGHQRDFSGRAYLPALVPQGVSAQSIQ